MCWIAALCLVHPPVAPLQVNYVVQEAIIVIKVGRDREAQRREAAGEQRTGGAVGRGWD